MTNSETPIQIEHPALQALWNMRWPALILCAPLLGCVMIDVIYGLPGKLWIVAAGFFIFGLALFTILVRGETHRIRQTARQR